MPGLVLHQGAGVTCLHQIPATVPGNPRVLVSGMPVATVPTFPVTGPCPFQIPVPPGTKPQPCLTIQWANVSARVQVMFQPVLTQAPPGPGVGGGTCMSGPIPNGPPTVVAVQPRVVAM
jgi:hypothetical protein